MARVRSPNHPRSSRNRRLSPAVNGKPPFASRVEDATRGRRGLLLPCDRGSFKPSFPNDRGCAGKRFSDDRGSWENGGRRSQKTAGHRRRRRETGVRSRGFRGGREVLGRKTGVRRRRFGHDETNFSLTSGMMRRLAPEVGREKSRYGIDPPQKRGGRLVI